MRLRLTAPATLLLAALVAALTAVPAQASSGEWSMFEDTQHLVFTDPVTRQQTLDELKGLGVDTLRVGVGWADVAPGRDERSKPDFDAKDPGAYPGFGVFDDLITRADKMGFRVLITLAPPAPRWGTAGGRGGNYNIDADRFADFAGAVAKRYSGSYNGLPTVWHYSIWNEPNHRLFLSPRSNSPRIYRRMVEKGVPAVRANAVAGATVFAGELAPVGTDTKIIGPLAFLRKWLCLDDGYKPVKGAKASVSGCKGFKKVAIDGFAHHPYGSQAPNTKPPPGRDIVNISVIGRLSKALDKAARAKRITARLPIYETEFGFQSNPPDPFVGITLTNQARLINEGEEISYRNPRIRSYSQYLLYDDASRPGSQAVKWAGFQTGLRFSGGTAKPSLEAYRLPIVVRKTRTGVKIWGRVRPGTGSRFVQLQRGASDDGGLIKTDTNGYFKVTRKARANYRFKGYVVDNGSQTLVGTSRLAKPIQ